MTISTRPSYRRLALIVWLAGCGGDEGPNGSADAGPDIEDQGPLCGNLIVEEGEQCDEGEANSDTQPNVCRTTCRRPKCGDAVVDDGEECDDGESNSDAVPDACRADCQEPSCGDGVVDSDEECDDGTANSDALRDRCRKVCQEPSCGDGVVDSNEECDDGDGIDDNSCTNACVTPVVWSHKREGQTGTSLAVNLDDSFFVAGGFRGGDGSADVWVSRYTDAGVPEWTEGHRGAAGGSDQAHGVAVDSTGHVLVAISEEVDVDVSDAIVRKYDASGVEVWTRSYPGIVEGDNGMAGVAVDLSDNVLVVGYDTNALGRTSVWLRKYASDGEALWTVTYESPNGGDAFGSALAVDSSDNILVSGVQANAFGLSEALVRKYDPGGSPLWTQTYAGAGDPYAEATGVAVDLDDNVVITGFEAISLRDYNIYVRKYDPDGGVLWTRSRHGLDEGVDWSEDVFTDSEGNILVTGTVTTVSGEQNDTWTGKYAPNGRMIWERTYAGEAGGFDCGLGVRVDSADNVLAVGYESMGSDWALWMTKYLP